MRNSSRFTLFTILALPILVVPGIHLLFGRTTEPRWFETSSPLGKCSLHERIYTERPYRRDLTLKVGSDILIPDVLFVERPQGNRWALVWQLKATPEPNRDVILVDIQKGAVERVFEYEGRPGSPFWNPDNSLGAEGVYNDRNVITKLELLECTEEDVIRHTVHSEKVPRAMLSEQPWAPDGSKFAYLTYARSESGTMNVQLVQVHVLRRPWAITSSEVTAESLELVIRWVDGIPEVTSESTTDSNR